MTHDIQPPSRIPVDKAVSSASADDYDALIIPGGAVNPGNLRQHPDAIAFVQAMVGPTSPPGLSATGPGCSSNPTSSEAAP